VILWRPSWIVGKNKGIFLVPFRTNKSFRAIIDDLGLSTGLQVCLDAGDIQSYNGTSQIWSNRASDYNFFKGTAPSAEGTDPTFNGTAGNLSENEYFSFDGGDFFTADVPNPEWVNNIHKDNAKFTFACWLYVNTLGVTHSISGNDALTVVTGFLFFVSVTNKLRFLTTNGAAVDIDISTTDLIGTGWNFLAISGDEQSNSVTFQINDIQESFAFTYPAPNTNNATHRLQAGAAGNDTFILPSGDRMGGLMVWNRSLSDSELMSIYKYPGLVFSDLGSPRSVKKMIGY
jgi:hypothetical protein